MTLVSEQRYFFVKTLGCKVNSFDSHAIENQLLRQGWQRTKNAVQANLTLINSCSVTANAEKEARYLARRFKRENPASFLVVAGCYAQTDSAALSALESVDFILPNEVKQNAAELITAAFDERKANPLARNFSKIPQGIKTVSNNKQGHFKSSASLFDQAESNQTRVFLKIQDGCNGFCTYCLIPYARGASRSVEADRILDEIKRQVDLGVAEIVLTGIHIGDYGKDLNSEDSSENLSRLIEKILKIGPKFRIRISSLEPCELSENLVHLMSAYRERFCDHFHLPLQSGSDRILKLMRRSYDTTEYRSAVSLVRKHFPDACVGADVIPGFPSETEADFEETYQFIRDVGLNYLHVFPYSSRPNTAAARMPEHLSPELVNLRSSRLRDLSRQLHSQYIEGFVGRDVHVLWENNVDAEGRRCGHSSNYLEVVASKDLSAHAGELQRVNLIGKLSATRLLATKTKNPFHNSQLSI